MLGGAGLLDVGKIVRKLASQICTGSGEILHTKQQKAPQVSAGAFTFNKP